MAITKNPRTGRYEGDWRDRSIGRLHLSLRTTKIGEARTRYAAVGALIAQGYTDLVDRLRKGAKRPLRIQAVERVHKKGGSFDELRDRAGGWPALGVAVDDYLAAIAAHPERTERTYQYAEQLLRVAVEHFGAERALDTITADDVLAYQTALREVRGISDNTLGTYLTRLGALYRWVQRRENRRAIEDKRAARTLYAPVDRELVPKFRQTRVRFLSREEAVRLYVACPPQYRLMVALGLYAGLRLMEAVMLRVPPLDVDLDVGLLHVQERAAPHPWHPKRRKNRDVPLSPALRRVLEQHIANGYAGDTYLTPAPPSLHPRASAAVAAGGGPFTPGNWRTEFTRIAKAAGLETRARHPMGVTPHTLRHTFASHSVMEGTDVFTVSRLLGHASTKQVETVYGHLAPEHKRRAVERLATRLALPLDTEEATS